jgi:hypothetical protein
MAASLVSVVVIVFVWFVLASRHATGHTLGADFETVNKIIIFFSLFSPALANKGFDRRGNMQIVRNTGCYL